MDLDEENECNEIYIKNREKNYELWNLSTLNFDLLIKNNLDYYSLPWKCMNS